VDGQPDFHAPLSPSLKWNELEMMEDEPYLSESSEIEQTVFVLFTFTFYCKGPPLTQA
jgi:hypothetical protein